MHLFFGLCHLTTLIYRLNITHAWKHLDLTHANMDPIPFCTLYFTTRSPCNPQIAGVRAVHHHTGHGYSLIKYIFRASNMTQKVKVPSPKLYKLSLTPGFTWQKKKTSPQKLSFDFQTCEMHACRQNKKNNKVKQKCKVLVDCLSLVYIFNIR